MNVDKSGRLNTLFLSDFSSSIFLPVIKSSLGTGSSCSNNSLSCSLPSPKVSSIDISEKVPGFTIERLIVFESVAWFASLDSSGFVIFTY
jgi:hypothetical protein